MKTKIINQQNLPKIKGTDSLSQYTAPKQLTDQRQQPSISKLISQIDQYLSTHSKNQVRDLLEKCSIHLKRIRQNNQSQIFGQTHKTNRKLITLGGRPTDDKQLEKQNKNPELNRCSVFIRKVINKRINREQSALGDFSDLTQNHSQVVSGKQARRISETQIIEKLRLIVKQKQRDISALKLNVQTLNQKIQNLERQMQNANDKKINQKQQTVMPLIEIHYPVQIIDPSLKSNINMNDPEMMEKYQNVCQEIDILREELARREQQGIYLYAMLNSDKN